MRWLWTKIKAVPVWAWGVLLALALVLDNYQLRREQQAAKRQKEIDRDRLKGEREAAEREALIDRQQMDALARTHERWHRVVEVTDRQKAKLDKIAADPKKGEAADAFNEAFGEGP